MHTKGLFLFCLKACLSAAPSHSCTRDPVCLALCHLPFLVRGFCDCAIFIDFKPHQGENEFQSVLPKKDTRGSWCRRPRRQSYQDLHLIERMTSLLALKKHGGGIQLLHQAWGIQTDGTSYRRESPANLKEMEYYKICKKRNAESNSDNHHIHPAQVSQSCIANEIVVGKGS